MEPIKVRKQGNSAMITVPAKFKIKTGTEFIPELRANGIFYRFTQKEDNFFNFDEDILSDLIQEGFSGQNLLKEFKKRRANINQGFNKMIDEALLEAKNTPTTSEEELRKEIGL